MRYVQWAAAGLSMVVAFASAFFGWLLVTQEYPERLATMGPTLIVFLVLASAAVALGLICCAAGMCGTREQRISDGRHLSAREDHPR